MNKATEDGKYIVFLSTY